MKIEISGKASYEIETWFRGYVKKFKHGDEELLRNIILKEEHTKRVVREILTLSEQVGLDAEGTRLAKITALLHDVGRFEQYSRYRTFNDGKSVNHAILGIEVLKQYDVLGSVSENVRELIFRVIGYHNRAKLPENEPEPGLFFSKLLRDADKLDIYKVVTDYYRRRDGKRNGAIELDLPDTPGISDAVYHDLINRQIVNVRDIRNLNDFKLLQAGWIFDINYKPTFDSVRERQYLEKIQVVLPESDEIRAIFKTIHDYIAEKDTVFTSGRGKRIEQMSVKA